MPTRDHRPRTLRPCCEPHFKTQTRARPRRNDNAMKSDHVGVLLNRREAARILTICRRAGIADLGELETVAELSLAVACLQAKRGN